jgi:hypothetical protein
MWHVKGNKQQLVPNLELIEWQERQVPIAFDADSYTNKNVRRNIKELATELERRGAVVTVADWDLELGKGIDDVLVNHGKDMINAIMNHKQPYADWLRNLENQFNASNASGSPTNGRKSSLLKMNLPVHLQKNIVSAWRGIRSSRLGTNTRKNQGYGRKSPQKQSDA